MAEDMSLIQQEYVLTHIEYATRLAKRFFSEHQPIAADYDDVVAAAYLGLCDAARRYDARAGVTFKTFSFLRIRGEMYDLLRKNSLQPRVRSKEEKSEPEQMVQISMQAPTPHGGHSVSEYAYEPLGLMVRSSPSEQHYELCYLEESTPSEQIEKESTAQYLQQILEDLPEVERRIIYLKYFEELSFSQISALLDGKHKSGLSRAHRRAIRRLREAVDSEVLASKSV